MNNVEWPSRRSLMNFAMTNAYFLGYSYLESLFYENLIISNQWIMRYIFLSGMASMRNYIMLRILTQGTKKYPYLHDHKKIPRLDEYFGYFLQLVFLDAFHQIIALDFLLDPTSRSQSLFITTLLFIPVSFLFEVIFDFFHYIAHRAEHTFPILYRSFHKTHHTHHHPTLITTYYHNLGDLLLTNALPLFATLLILKTSFLTPLPIPISPHLFFAIYLAKSYMELCGHSGKDIQKTGSFVQCVWLPRLLGIDLYTADHDAHHRLSNGNYGKRFSLWDRVFGTMI